MKKVLHMVISVQPQISQSDDHQTYNLWNTHMPDTSAWYKKPGQLKRKHAP